MSAITPSFVIDGAMTVASLCITTLCIGVSDLLFRVFYQYESWRMNRPQESWHFLFTLTVWTISCILGGRIVTIGTRQFMYTLSLAWLMMMLAIIYYFWKRSPSRDHPADPLWFLQARIGIAPLSVILGYFTVV